MYKKSNAKYCPNKLREVQQTGAILVSQVCRVVLPLLSFAYLFSHLFPSLFLSFFSSVSRVSFHFVHMHVSFPSFFVCSDRVHRYRPCGRILSTVRIYISLSSLFLSLFRLHVLNRTWKRSRHFRRVENNRQKIKTCPFARYCMNKFTSQLTSPGISKTDVKARHILR